MDAQSVSIFFFFKVKFYLLYEHKPIRSLLYHQQSQYFLFSQKTAKMKDSILWSHVWIDFYSPLNSPNSMCFLKNYTACSSYFTKKKEKTPFFHLLFLCSIPVKKYKQVNVKNGTGTNGNLAFSHRLLMCY